MAVEPERYDTMDVKMLTCMDLRTCDLRDWVWSGVCLAGCHVFTIDEQMKSEIKLKLRI